MNTSTLHVRSLGRVNFHEADILQRALHAHDDDYLLFLEHNPVYTLGSATEIEHTKNIATTDDFDVVDVDRGGSITFHGPGQLIGYPLVTVGETRGDFRSSLAFIRNLEDTLIEALRILGVEAIKFENYTGVWVDRGENLETTDRYAKIAAIGVKVAQGRTRHGFALNVSTDLTYFDKIIPCGIEEYSTTSLHDLGHTHIDVEQVADCVSKCFIERFGYDEVTIASVNKTGSVDGGDVTSSDFALHRSEMSASSPSHNLESLSSKEAVSAVQPSLRLMGRLAQAGVVVDLDKDRRARPEWMKNKFVKSEGFTELKELSRGLNLHTVCEEAGCPNIYECWESKTATFMILGERCTRACGFCLIDTRKPQAPDLDEPRNVGHAVKELGLEYAVITCVARDDLDDDGSDQFVQTVREIRKASPGTSVELLISDCRGHANSLDAIFAERPEVLNHNIESVARLQRAVRPSAGYARSLGVLARAKQAGLITKSGIIVGMGETASEVLETLRDLKNIGIDIVTIGQYLQPTPSHLPVHRFVTPEEFDMYREYGETIGIGHVESGPLVRSSYHAKSAADVAFAPV